jgi:hypothetical protein
VKRCSSRGGGNAMVGKFRCGLPEGHDGQHSALTPTGVVYDQDAGDEPPAVPVRKRYFDVDVGGCVSYSIVAAGASEAWKLFGEYVAGSGSGEDMLDDEVTMGEIDAARAAELSVHDDGRDYPLTEAEFGAVFCSEY